jgi:uncharacterized protein (DUF4415 family)
MRFQSSPNETSDSQLPEMAREVVLFVINWMQIERETNFIEVDDWVGEELESNGTGWQEKVNHVFRGTKRVVVTKVR